ncbi:MAG: phosphoenolpyruvate--protein phosphotransferase [Candidatus Eisenbacteria bacterium]
MASKALQGIAASPGLAIGPARVLPRADLDVVRRTVEPAQAAAECARLDAALAGARGELGELVAQVDALHEEETEKILDVQVLLLDDPAVREEAHRAIRDEHVNAEFAFHRMFARAASTYEASDAEVFRDRAVDFRDISRRVLRHLRGGPTSRLADIDTPSIIVAHDVEPSETIHFHKGKVLAVITDEGGRTAHSALIARSHGIPAVVGLQNATREVRDGDIVAVDGYSGAVWPRPSARRAARFQRRIKVLAAHGKELEALRDLPATTPDGRSIELSANLEIPEEVGHVIESGATGVGLYRTEFFYLGRPHLPTEEEQTAAYRAVAEQLKPRPVIIRTMDLGGDKVASYMRSDDEANPFLGWRGIRFALHHPEVFTTQLRAIFRASTAGNVKMMFPMVTTYDELDQALALCDKVKRDLTREKVPFDARCEIGMMVETPSAVWSADIMARRVSFFSIGSNDLIQYTLAMDRGNAKIAYLYEPLDPAVLRSVNATVQAGHAAGIWVGVCGEMAGDPRIAALLLGMDVDELSVSPFDLPRVKAVVRTVPYATAKSLATRALALPSAKEIRRLLDKDLDPLLPAALLGEDDAAADAE